MHETLTWPPDAEGHRLRRVAARWLRLASRGLDHWAQRLAEAPAAVVADTCGTPVLEFHPGPGRDEGSLYLDGRRWLTLPGVTRL